MNTKFLRLPAFSWAIVSCVGAGATLAQDRAIERDLVAAEPTPEVACPCACDWEYWMGAGNVCDIFDFIEFQNAFVKGDPCAINVDVSTGNGVGDIFDFLAFQYQFLNRMFQGC